MRQTEVSLPEAAGAVPAGWSQLAREYAPRIRAELAGSIVRFWRRTLDAERGGVFNCWNNAGTQLVSRDKFTWSQGRFLWLWSRLAEATGRGLLPGTADEFLAHAEKTFRFLRTHAFLDDGRCAFLLTEDGRPKEPGPGLGLAASIYADCFVAMGFAEFARVSRDRQVLASAWSLFLSIETRIAAGNPPTHPTPIPPDHEAYALAMIFLNVALVVAAACVELDAPERLAAEQRCTAAAAKIHERFLEPAGRIAEFRKTSGADDASLIGRHVNPGHALEGTWMLLAVAARARRADSVARTCAAVRFAFEVGWDREHQGLLYYVDREGGPPRGAAGGFPYEAAVRDRWDHKLWWVHSEAIFASLLAYRLSGERVDGEWFRRVFDYAFRVFPHPDRAVGEWIQIRNRRGEPIETVVALPVKDPYHIARNLLQSLELLSI